ncbi:MAG TPA: hypothetical protein VMH27_17970 [Puia sp.]|nr:hypothetical protein [Puia sp.]
MIKKYKISPFIFGAFILFSLSALLTTKSMTLERKIELTDYITLIALAITFVAGAFAIYFKGQQAKELNAQRERDRVAIAQSNEKSELARQESENAKKDAANSNEKAANAELRSKELEIELLNLRLSVSDRFLPMVTVLTLKHQKS